MYSLLLLFLLLSAVQAQYYSPQQYPYNNYNLGLPYSPNYPVWNQGIQQSKLIDFIYYIKNLV